MNKPAQPLAPLTKVERVVYTTIHAVWDVHGLDNDNWDRVRTALQAAENAMWTLEDMVTSPEVQLLVEVQQALNFLWWTAHAAEYGEIKQNPYHLEYKS